MNRTEPTKTNERQPAEIRSDRGIRLDPVGYSLPSEIEGIVRSLAESARHNGIHCHRETIGSSSEGRPIQAYRWSRDLAADSEASVLLLSQVHPMEWIGRDLHIALVRDIAQGSLPLPKGTSLLSVPDVNPDGSARVESALREGRWAWVRGNARGIDLNRNFGVGHRTRPWWIDWWPMWRPGPGPSSEPESKAIDTWTATRPIRLSLSLHSFGRWIFYPPGYARGGGELDRRHRNQLEETLRRAPAETYRSSALGSWAWWFRAYGTEIDHLAARTGGLAYLVEVARSGFARWGVRRSLHPFFTFNPPDPESEIARIKPTLAKLMESVWAPASGSSGSP